MLVDGRGSDGNCETYGGHCFQCSNRSDQRISWQDAERNMFDRMSQGGQHKTG